MKRTNSQNGEAGESEGVKRAAKEGKDNERVLLLQRPESDVESSLEGGAAAVSVSSVDASPGSPSPATSAAVTAKPATSPEGDQGAKEGKKKKNRCQLCKKKVGLTGELSGLIMCRTLFSLSSFRLHMPLRRPLLRHPPLHGQTRLQLRFQEARRG